MIYQPKLMHNLIHLWSRKWCSNCYKYPISWGSCLFLDTCSRKSSWGPSGNEYTFLIVLLFTLCVHVVVDMNDSIDEFDDSLEKEADKPLSLYELRSRMLKDKEAAAATKQDENVLNFTMSRLVPNLFFSFSKLIVLIYHYHIVLHWMRERERFISV